MESIMRKKRNSLETFVREQTLGPGVRGYRFVDISNNNLFSNNLLSVEPLEYMEEILNISPARIYSTGILFPKDGSNSLLDGRENESIVSEDLVGDYGLA